MIYIVLQVFLWLNSIEFSHSMDCDEMKSIAPLKFKLLKAHTKSQNYIITRREISTLKECFEFAIMKKALAVNFRRFSQLKNTNKNNIRRLNCQPLGCPETNSLDELVEDKKYNYYSAYSRNIKLGNDTPVCLPSIGLFVRIKELMNFSNAQSACSNIRGKLADVMSEERSEAMIQFIYDKTPVYVGLSNQGTVRRWKNEFGQSLDCTEYSAWAPENPSSRGCVALIRQNTHKTLHVVWRVFPCSTPLPFICEILSRVKK